MKGAHLEENSFAMHFVCTLPEAELLLRGRSRFWVSNCGCRQQRGSCSRSPAEVCLSFRGDIAGTGSDLHEISPEEVLGILRTARDSALVCRPFRDPEDRGSVDGICFCCDDCCSYFLDTSEACDRGALAEETDLGLCSQCDACVPICRFGARTTGEKGLAVDRGRCFGCGLCAQVCPVGAVRMVPRVAPSSQGPPGNGRIRILGEKPG